MRWRDARIANELSDIYNATLTYSDPTINRIYLSAQGIEDGEAIYDSLWFLDAKDDGKDDLFLAVFRKEDGTLHIYTSGMNPSETHQLRWKMKEVDAPHGLLTTYLPKQIGEPKYYMPFAIRCDGVTDFYVEEVPLEN